MAYIPGPFDVEMDKIRKGFISMAKDKTKYYDVETGEERVWSHDPTSCLCPDWFGVESALDDIIKAKGAFAPSSRKHKSKVPYEKFKPKHDWFGVDYGKTEPDTSNDEGKCFGWNPEAQEQLVGVDWDMSTNKYVSREEMYMVLTDKPMSPDMTRNDMAVMSVDQQKACLTLKVTYNPFFNERMKRSIEFKYRNWNPHNKCWEFHPSMMKQIQAICMEFYKGVQIIGQKPVLGTKFEKLLSKLTKDDKQSIYRLMALKYHPDKGGDHETMSLLNEVFKQQ